MTSHQNSNGTRQLPRMAEKHSGWRTVGQVSAGFIALGLVGVLATAVNAQTYRTEQGEPRTGYGKTRDGVRPPQPLVLQDMSGGGKLKLSFPILPGSDWVGFAPRVGLYGGRYLARHGVNLSYGIVVPMSTVFLDVPLPGTTNETQFILGNVTGDIKAGKCFDMGTFSWCAAGAFAAGFGFVTVDSPAEALAYQVGLSAAQDPVYYMAETAVLRPLFVTHLLGQRGFVLQGEVGPAIGIPLRNTTGRDTEVMMMWGAGLGYKMGALLPMVEGRGIHGVTDGVDSYEAYWINVGASLLMDWVTPSLRLGFPLNDDARVNDGHKVQVELALTARW